MYRLPTLDDFARLLGLLREYGLTGRRARQLATGFRSAGRTTRCRARHERHPPSRGASRGEWPSPARSCTTPARRSGPEPSSPAFNSHWDQQRLWLSRPDECLRWRYRIGTVVLANATADRPVIGPSPAAVPRCVSSFSTSERGFRRLFEGSCDSPCFSVRVRYVSPGIGRIVKESRWRQCAE